MKRSLVAEMLAAIFFVAVLVRFIGLGTNPVGFVDDEADEGYDAYSLLLTGHDQWGTTLPLLAFKGFGDFRPPLYTYLTVPSVKLFGLTPFAVRLPSALLGSLTVLAVFFLATELFRESKYSYQLALLSALLLAVSSWHIGMSRIASEAVVSVFLVTVGLYVFFVSRRKTVFMPAAGFLLGLSVYAYTANIVFIPLLLFVLLYIFRDTYLKKLRARTIGTIIIFLLIVAPIGIVGNTGSSVRTKQVNLTNDSGLIDVLNEKRGACTALLPITVCRLVYNKYYVFSVKFVDNYLHHFSPDLLNISGTSTQYSVLPSGGLFYLVEIPFLLLGVYTAFHTKNKAGIFMTLFLLVSALPDSITSDGHYSRYFISLPSWQILTAIGIVSISELNKSKRYLISLAVFLFVVEIFTFGMEYITYFPYRYSVYSHYGYKELVQDVVKNGNRYDNIFISGRVNDAKQYIFYLFFTQYDPLSFQRGIGVVKGLDSLGWVRVERIGSVNFVQSLPPIDKQTIVKDRELFIGAPSEFPRLVYIPTQFTIKDKKGDVLFEAVDVQDFIRCINVVCSPSTMQ